MHFTPRERVSVYRVTTSGERESVPCRRVSASLAFELFSTGHATLLWASRKKIFGLLLDSRKSYTRLMSSAPRGTSFIYRERMSTSPAGIYSHKRAVKHQFRIVPQGRKVVA